MEQNHSSIGTDKLFVYSIIGVLFHQRMKPSSSGTEGLGHWQRQSFINPHHKHAGNLRSFWRSPGYIPTSMLSEEEKAARRERVRLQVRASRMRKKLREAQQHIQSGFQLLPTTDSNE